MIAAYAQATERQGLDVALNGHPVPSTTIGFTEIRQKAVAVNLTKARYEFDGGEVRFGRGIVRVEITAAAGGDDRLSPIVVVVDAAELLSDGETVAVLAAKSVAAIDRECEPQALALGLAMGEQLVRDSQTKRRVVAAVTLVAIGVTAFVIARHGATADGLFGASGNWNVR